MKRAFEGKRFHEDDCFLVTWEGVSIFVCSMGDPRRAQKHGLWSILTIERRHGRLGIVFSHKDELGQTCILLGLGG